MPEAKKKIKDLKKIQGDLGKFYVTQRRLFDSKSCNPVYYKTAEFFY